MEENFHTTKDISVFLGVSKWTVYRLIRKGKLKAIKVERQFRVAAEDLKKFIKELKRSVQK